MRRFGWLGVLLAVFLGTACGPANDDKTSDATQDTSSSSSSAKPGDSGVTTADPPVTFAGKPVTFKPSVVTTVPRKSEQEIATIRDRTAYIVGGKGLGAYDVLTGKELWTAPGPEYVGGLPTEDEPTPPNPSGPLAPALSADGKTVAAAFPYYTEAGPMVKVVVADAQSGAVDVDLDLAMPVYMNWDGNTGNLYARPLAVTGESVLVTAGYDPTILESQLSFTIDRGTKKVGWRRDKYAASGLYGSLVVGTVHLTGADIRVLALDAATGKDRWHAFERSTSVRTMQASAGTVLTTYLKSSDQGGVEFLASATGKPKRESYTVPAVMTPIGFLTCVSDAKDTLVCSHDLASGAMQVTAYDGAGGSRLWQRSFDFKNNLPTVTAWHGAVYVGPGDGSTVILDARTGKQRGQLPEQDAPYWVGAFAGLRAEEDASFTSLPTGG